MNRTAPPPVFEGKPRLTATWSDLADLSPARIHALFRLRVAVFVVEQACAYAEIDGRDPDADHFLLETEGGTLVACLRLLPPDADNGAPRLGRIATKRDWRGLGLGGYLLKAGVARACEQWPDLASELSAQAHLKGFYAAHGFRPVSDVYDEDGIPHIDMRRTAGTDTAAAAPHEITSENTFS
ncbi:GNAT family N-acetyltransferase [Stappia sp. ES.058]|uniref:GNAT family N-acetyltransferase n=1 Tax=Stappia sp. ES.058 TaxID=1881061 RepID=UPI00087D15E9|nr:GNAT family N-acetyltransferase [Stappia sp. ES.058]SDU26085.1 ElaA protein [Stappia sp. ES.058]